MRNFLIKVFISTLVLVAGSAGLAGQVTTTPPLPTAANQVVLTFNAAGTELAGHTGDLYAHTGVTIEGAANPSDNGRWRYVIGSWGNNTTQPRFTQIGPNTYQLTIGPSIRQFYNVPEGLTITEICLVIRSSASPFLQTRPDIFLSVVQPGLTVAITAPTGMQPVFDLNQTVVISGTSNQSTSLSLFVNETLTATTTQTSLTHNWVATSTGRHNVRMVAQDASQNTAEASAYFYVRGQVPVAPLPAGVKNGINYIDDRTATLVLHDPPGLKQYAFVIGDFNNWELSDNFYMNRTPDGKHFWLTVSNLTPNTEYAFQYYIDGKLRLADPYTHKVLDPWNDKWIPAFNYPNLKPYPEGKTEEIVSILHTARPQYQWQTTNFRPPAPRDMVIYELHIRDFVDTRAIKSVQERLDYLQTLGVNVIELMPINEFEGNSSWGYNSSFYFATDKAYGTINDYKAFIDECHRRGIAVVIDMVLNHSFGQSPLVRMYSKLNPWEPSAVNPWFNEFCPHEPWCWGADFNHLSPYTQAFIDRVNEFWLTEFKVDGFRFDFTKGFTNVQTANQGWNYDAVRVALLKRMADNIWRINPDAYVILEHFTDNTEEKELADYGMLIWGNMHYNYQEAAMGWITNSNFQWISHRSRNYNHPHLIGYMESHDEERIMYQNLNFGNSSNPLHNIRNLNTGLRRIELAATFFLTIPGPKMIWQFGELGYDFSINFCPHNNTINNACRTDPKPVRWDYLQDWRRKRVYDVFSLLANLKTSQDVFRTNDFSLDLGGAVKRIWLNHTSNRVFIIGNFGVNEATVNTGFQQTGTWHEYFTGQTLNVTNANMQMSLQPGEYRLYSTEAFPAHGLPLSSNDPLFEQPTQARVFPNPSAEGFWFEVPVNTPGKATLEVFNLQGQQVYRQEHEALPGINTYFWDGFAGDKEKTGLYFYRISTAREQFSGRLMIR